jgi:hypothetical protein
MIWQFLIYYDTQEELRQKFGGIFAQESEINA